MTEDVQKEIEDVMQGKERIKLTKKYYLSWDSRQFILQERSVSEAGRENFNNFGYYANLKHLLRALMEKEIKTKKIEEIKDLKNHVDNIADEIYEQITKNSTSK